MTARGTVPSTTPNQVIKWVTVNKVEQLKMKPAIKILIPLAFRRSFVKVVAAA